MTKSKKSKKTQKPKARKPPVKQNWLNQQAVAVKKHVKDYRAAIFVKRDPVYIGLTVMMIATALLSGLATYNYLRYQNLTLPGLIIAGVEVGDLDRDDLVGYLETQLSQTTVKLELGDKSIMTSASKLGVTVDDNVLHTYMADRSITEYMRPWFIEKHVDLATTYDIAVVNKTLDAFKRDDFKQSIDASFTLSDDQKSLVISDGQDGFGIDTKKTITAIQSHLSRQLSPINSSLQAAKLNARINAADVRARQDQLLKYATLKYELAAGEQKVVASPVDIISWLRLVRLTDATVAIQVSSDAVKAFVAGAAGQFDAKPVNQLTTVYKSGKPSRIENGVDGRQVTNVDQLTTELIAKVTAKQPYSGSLIVVAIAPQKITQTVDDTPRVVTYDVAVWGSVSSDLGVFKSLAAETLSDPRGWAAGGVNFVQVSSGGNFTLVLADPASVAAASPGCGAEWSCRAGRNVIINDARWGEGTTAWNNGGGSLRDYRHMVVNHEVGHWLGFAHRYCSGAGQLAPVMQQQSISLQGCNYNPWPLASEIGSL